MLIELYNKLKSIDFDELKMNAIIQNDEGLIRLNQLALRAGEDSLGKPLWQYTDEYYEEVKRHHPEYRAKGRQANLLLSGKFYEGFRVTVDSHQVVIYSTDEKSESLQSYYGEYIFGIQEELSDDAIEMCTKKFFELLNKKL
jgi:hypothetical protein